MILNEKVFVVVLTKKIEAEGMNEVVAGEREIAKIELVRSNTLPQIGRCPQYSCQTDNDCRRMGRCPFCHSHGYCLNP